MMNEYLITTIVGVLTGLAAWVTARRKNLAETHLSELDAVEKAAGIWRKLSENMQTKYDALLERQEKLEQEVNQLRLDNEVLKRKNQELVRKIKRLSGNDSISTSLNDPKND